MNLKYYYTPNATKRIKAGKFQIQFEAVDLIGGVWSGITATSNPEEQAALAQLGANGVVEITQTEYEGYAKKNSRPNDWSSSRQLTPQPEPSKPSPAAPAVAGAAIGSSEPAAVPEKIEEVIQLGQVLSSEPEPVVIPVKKRGRPKKVTVAKSLEGI
jgi:hypothetical protein